MGGGGQKKIAKMVQPYEYNRKISYKEHNSNI